MKTTSTYPVRCRSSFVCRRAGSGRQFFLLLMLFLAGAGSSTRAQSPTQLMNAELRHLFSNLNNPNPAVRFFYDMSAHTVDEKFYKYICDDTSNVDNWYNLYSEMYYAAYDTTLFTRMDTVFQRAYPYIQHDTVPIGIIDWRYNRLKPDALTTNNYFDFDTVNQLLYDKVPQPVSPYDIDTLFTASPLVREVPYANTVFQVNPDFIFHDPDTRYDPDARIIKIDFDDGNGWVTFNTYAVQNYQVLYPSAGLKFIKVATFDPFSNVMLTSSLSVLRVLSATVTVPPDDVITSVTGIDVGVYDNNCNPNMMKKYVIYLEGTDLLNNRSVDEIYTEMINDDNLAQLRNFGYTFVVVSWQNPNASIQSNAMKVVQLLDYLKCQTDSVAPFVVIGESMGGLVGKYALAYMESAAYDNGKDPWTCKKALKHHTRLFLTYDSPHQGANIPLGVQQLYRNLAPIAYMLSGFNNGIANIYNNALLNGTSAKQMLLYHVETESNPGLPINSSHYSSSSLRGQLLSDFAALGNYPKYCKMMAISNGSLDGARQEREWDGAPRQPNDFLLRLETDFYLRVLGIKFVGSHTDLQIRTNPAGDGTVFELNKGISHWKIKLKWFGIKIVWDHTNLVKVRKGAREVLPYCVSAASNNGFSNPFANPSDSHAGDIAHLLGFDYDYTIDGQGNLVFNSSLYSLLVPWMININLDGSAYSDGFDFGFIPVQSSFDYHADDPNNLDYNIYNDPVYDIMGRTPFDAVNTNPTGRNRNHLTVPNPELAPYATCMSDDISSYLLPREIGDDTLWLENTRTLPAGCIFEAERELYVNVRNPYYNYPSSSTSIPTFQHGDRRFYVISKEDPVSITSMPVTLRANNSVTINPFQPLWGPYQIRPGNMILCCEDFVQRPAAGNVAIPAAIARTSAMELYPNPSNGHNVTIKYHFAEHAPVTALIYSLEGRLLGKVLMPFGDNTLESYFTVDISKMGLSAGTYLVQLTNGKESLYKKLSVIN